ncbi:hypothetical protein MLD38_035745 [Melastoma candidum]|uniref:Uncharacterized protein n=1 Tax=Melastoma candidum TaxID=119954 RepID=A0ACB9LH28_9MYRT|nr:hypothetical protein MLD38_035745 [Melastoma candidum]
MDLPPEEMRFMGFVSIFKESFKIIGKYRKVLSLITVTLIFPLALIFLVQIQVADHLRYAIYRHEERLEHKKHNSRLSDLITSERIGYVVLKVLYYAILLVLANLAMSAVVYLVASIYTVKPISFKKVMGIVPKVWKRLSVTLCWVFLISFIYACFTLGFSIIIYGVVGWQSEAFGLTVFIISFIAHFVGFAYLCIIWYLASVITVLEDLKGISAMVKAKDLIQGKKKVVVPIFLLLAAVYYGVLLVYEIFVVFEWNSFFLFGLGTVCVVLLTFLFLLGLVVQSVTYFVCKTYHCEHIDKPALAEHLEAFAPNYEQMKEGKDVQMNQVYV